MDELAPIKEMSPPWLSVIVPTCNGGLYLDSTLESIAQNGKGIEVIAIDDGSTDNTPQILERFASRLDMRIIKRAAGNWVANSNHALALARGKYACFLHQDDVWLPQRSEVLRTHISRHPDAVVFFHSAQYIDAKGKYLGRLSCGLPTHSFAPAEMVGRLLIQNSIACSAAIFLTEKIRSLNGLDETLWYTADWDLWLHLSAHAKAVYIDACLSAFRLHARSQTAQRSESIADFRWQMETVLQRHYESWQADAASRRQVARCARLSIEINVALATLYHRKIPSLRLLCIALATMRPSDWPMLLKYSRLHQRVLARVKAGL